MRMHASTLDFCFHLLQTWLENYPHHTKKTQHVGHHADPIWFCFLTVEASNCLAIWWRLWVSTWELTRLKVNCFSSLWLSGLSLPFLPCTELRSSLLVCPYPESPVWPLGHLRDSGSFPYLSKEEGRTDIEILSHFPLFSRNSHIFLWLMAL